MSASNMTLLPRQPQRLSRLRTTKRPLAISPPQRFNRKGPCCPETVAPTGLKINCASGDIGYDGHCSNRVRQISTPIGADSAHSEVHSVHSDSDSAHKGDHSAHKGGHSTHNDLQAKAGGHIPAEQWSRLQSIAMPAQQNRRLDPQAMEGLIIRLCGESWLTKANLGELLDRNGEGLRSRYLAIMVAHGFLKLRYPDKPNRTDQAYRAVDSDDGDAES